MKKKITITVTCIIIVLIIGASLIACQHKKTSETAANTSQSETDTATPSPTATMQEKKEDKSQKESSKDQKSQTIVNEDGETGVLFPENPQSEAEKQDTTPSKKDPGKQPDQKESEITEDGSIELPMVPFED